MPRWMWRPLRMLSALALAVIAGATVVLERRRGRRAAAAGPQRTPPPDRPRPQAQAQDDQAGTAPAPLPPWQFVTSHFGLLVLLLAMMVAGLALQGIHRYPPDTHFHVNGGDPARGRQAMARHGCGGCHVIPGIRGATGRVGPSLDGFAEQMYVGGQLPNTPEHLIAWLQAPQRYAPGTAMPNLPVTEAEARDMAAYLYSR